MTVLYHLSDQGPAPCKASVKSCPKGDNSHYATLEAAEHAYSEKQGGVVPAVVSKGLSVSATPPAPERISLQLDFGEVELTNGDLSTPQNRFYFANGLCGDLALAVQEHQGGQAFFVMEELSPAELESAAAAGKLGDYVAHAVISSKHAPGKFLDSYGVKSREELEGFYGMQLQPVSRELLQSYGSGERGARGEADLSKFAATVAEFDRQGQSYSYTDFGEA